MNITDRLRTIEDLENTLESLEKEKNYNIEKVFN